MKVRIHYYSCSSGGSGDQCVQSLIKKFKHELWICGGFFFNIIAPLPPIIYLFYVNYPALGVLCLLSSDALDVCTCMWVYCHCSFF